jgi:hypothetical protein
VYNTVSMGSPSKDEIKMMPNPPAFEAASDDSSIHLLAGYNCSPNSSMTLTSSPKLSPPSSPPPIPSYARRSPTPYSPPPTSTFYTPTKYSPTSSMSLSYDLVPLRDTHTLIKIEEKEPTLKFDKSPPTPLNTKDVIIFHASSLPYIKNIGAAFSAPTPHFHP